MLNLLHDLLRVLTIPGAITVNSIFLHRCTTAIRSNSTTVYNLTDIIWKTKCLNVNTVSQ